jgi:hypothetical protein
VLIPLKDRQVICASSTQLIEAVDTSTCLLIDWWREVELAPLMNSWIKSERNVDSIAVWKLARQIIQLKSSARHEEIHGSTSNEMKKKKRKNEQFISICKRETKR